MWRSKTCRPTGIVPSVASARTISNRPTTELETADPPYARVGRFGILRLMQKIDRKAFVQGVAALGVATAATVSFGKEGKDMKKTDLKTLASENAFDLIGKGGMLVTAGNKEKLNTMTASWGGIGWLWNRPVAFVFIRP